MTSIRHEKCHERLKLIYGFCTITFPLPPAAISPEQEKWVKDQWKELYFQLYFLKYLDRNVFNCREVLSLVIIIISCLDSGTNSPSLCWFYFLSSFFFSFILTTLVLIRLCMCIFIIIHLKAFLWNINYKDIKVNREQSPFMHIFTNPKTQRKRELDF